MKALILAAGKGSRLTAVSNGTPKGLVKFDEFGGVGLIEYQLAVLRSLGITDVTVVVGYRADLFEKAIGNHCNLIYNEDYDKTNSLYSLWLARHWMDTSFFLMNSDVLAHPQIYRKLSRVRGNVLAYDALSGNEDEHMKVSFLGHRLRRISKALSVRYAQGESIGLMKFDVRSVPGFFRAAEQALESGGPNQWSPAAVEQFAQKEILTGLNVAGIPWVEIDFPEDFMHASVNVWPEIQKEFGTTLPVLSECSADSNAYLRQGGVCHDL